MDDKNTYSKKLCMTEIAVQRNSFFDNTNINGDNTVLGFLARGSASVRSAGNVIEIREGSLFYIPGGIRCHPIRRGPDIELYLIQIISGRLADTDSTRYEMACIPELSCPSIRFRIENIYELMKSGERVKMIRAIGQYYELFADVFPYLRTETPRKYNPILVSAMEYIDCNYGDGFNMDELASFCCVSQSRLYHLFQKELGTTPLKYRNEIRVEKAASELRGTARSIEDIALSCGIKSNTHFRKVFREITGMTPAEYRAADIYT